MIPLHQTPEGVTFAVRVHPRARKNAVIGKFGDALKISLTSPPLEGRANQACIEFLAAFFGIPRSAVAIVTGETSRNKVVRISGLAASQVRDQLAGSLPLG